MTGVIRMARITERLRPHIAVGLEKVPSTLMVPPTLMIAMGHPWLGAATLGGVLAASAIQSWIVVRSAQERQRAVLSYAQDATNLGTDPAPVIAALRRHAAAEDDEAPSRPPDEW